MFSAHSLRERLRAAIRLMTEVPATHDSMSPLTNAASRYGATAGHAGLRHE